MSQSSSDRLIELLQLAEKRPLTETEQAMLQKLLANEDNRLAASAQQHLQSHYVATGQARQWSAAELEQIAKDIDRQTMKQTRRQQIHKGMRQMVWATIAILVIIGGFTWWALANPSAIEPVAEIQATATPTVAPTPTLAAGYIYADLSLPTPVTEDPLVHAVYSQTIAEAVQEWSDNLYLPQQLPEEWTVAGATIDEENNVFEIAFVHSRFGREIIWILSQSPIGDRTLHPPLPVSYQPLPQIDKTNEYENAPTAVGELPAHAYQYEFVYEGSNQTEWIVLNTVSWQVEAQLLTLTQLSDNLQQTGNIAEVAQNFSYWFLPAVSGQESTIELPE